MLYQEKAKHKLVDTGYISRRFQNGFIRSNCSGWKRCGNPLHALKGSMISVVCLKKCK